jgi:multiple sugar transport system permease protein
MALNTSRSELLPGQKRWSIGSLAADVGLVFWFVFSLFPIIWMFILALKNAEQHTTTFFAFSPSANCTLWA